MGIQMTASKLENEKKSIVSSGKFHIFILVGSYPNLHCISEETQMTMRHTSIGSQIHKHQIF